MKLVLGNYIDKMSMHHFTDSQFMPSLSAYLFIPFDLFKTINNCTLNANKTTSPFLPIVPRNETMPTRTVCDAATSVERDVFEFMTPRWMQKLRNHRRSSKEATQEKQRYAPLLYW